MLIHKNAARSIEANRYTRTIRQYDGIEIVHHFTPFSFTGSPEHSFSSLTDRQQEQALQSLHQSLGYTRAFSVPMELIVRGMV